MSINWNSNSRKTKAPKCKKTTASLHKNDPDLPSKTNAFHTHFNTTSSSLLPGHFNEMFYLTSSPVLPHY